MPLVEHNLLLKLLMKFQFNLDHFVTVSFSSLPKIINSIGDITLDRTNDNLKYINNYINYNSAFLL